MRQRTLGLALGVLAGFCVSNFSFYSLGSHQRQPAQLSAPAQGWQGEAPEEDYFPNTCEELAREEEESYTEEYLPTNRTVDLNGTQWAFYRWTGSKIDLKDIEELIQKKPSFHLRFKILNKKLYYQEEVFDSAVTYIKYRAKLLLSGIMMAMVWFDIPDVDFIVDLGDFPENDPSPAIVICSNNKTGVPGEGFTVPFDLAIEKVLGPEQMSYMLACLKARYPSENRLNTIVWRGSFRYEEEDRFNPRKEVSFLVKKMNAMVDFGFVRYFLPKTVDCAQWAYPSKVPGGEVCPEPVPGMIMEQFNRYAFVMDIDGRGWSGRLPFLMSSNTPIVKHVTQFVDYASAHLLNDHPVEFFKNDLSDFVDVVRESHYKRNRSPVEYHESMVRKMQEFSRTHYTHFGIARAMAYGLTAYASKINWIPDSSGNFTQVPLDYFMITTLPQFFLENLRSQLG